MMDAGPVDAAPVGESEYGHAQLESHLSEERLRNLKISGLRSSSLRRNQGDGDTHKQETPSDNHDDSISRSRMSSESAGASDDPPLYQRVGATTEDMVVGSDAEEEISLKEEPIAKPAEHIQSGSTLHRMYKFTLYETNARYWITGADITDQHYKMLRIDRTSPPGQISLFEDDVVYEKRQLHEILASIDEGNQATGGLRVKYSFWGLLGFIRFTEAYYMIIITKRNSVAMIGGHYVYQVDGTELVPLTTGASSKFMRDRNSEETRFLGILNNLDLTRSFYFSYAYDITRSLQHNIIKQRTALNQGKATSDHDFNDMFVWNHHLLKPARNALKHPYDWCLPIIHGFIDQAALDIFGRSVYITIIGRRSRFFAGARFLKRGVNDSGYVANDVETEQIISEMLTTSFHAPGPRLFSNPTWTSYVHHRGSIPLYWTQDNSGVTPKPDIDLNLQDPFYQPAALHFDNLFERYGCSVYVLNLIKSRERTPRESKLLIEFKHCLDYLNQALPDDKKITYKAFDMSRASKTRGGDVIGNLEAIAEEIVSTTGFFHNGDPDHDTPQVQNGIARTNCVDCLDRTNAAQFVIGKRAFGKQLQALGVLAGDVVDYDTDAVNIFTHMFHDHGDTIAVQYGGSHLVNTMATYRKLNQWQSQTRDMVEGFKRYYHNSFLDSQRQEAYNLFLGNYIWAQGEPMLWDLVSDYYLHHSDPRNYLQRNRRDYYQWYTPDFLKPRIMPPPMFPNPPHIADDNVENTVIDRDDYWLEYYRPAALSSFLKIYSYRMNSTSRHLPDRPHTRDIKHYDFSPFKPRLDHQRANLESPEKKPVRKGVKIIDPVGEPPDHHKSPPNYFSRPPTANGEERPSILREPSVNPFATQIKTEKDMRQADKAQMHLWSLNQLHTHSLNPSVTDAEEAEYGRYVTHPHNLPLVTSSEIPSDANIDYVEYLHKSSMLVDAVDRHQRDVTFDDDDAFSEPTPIWLSEQDLREFEGFLEAREDPLTVTEEDGGKKRYKAYRQWLRGKSLFKQSKVDPEYTTGL